MKTVKLKTFAGNTFDNVAEEAKVQATNEGVIVEFNFNGILCKVSKKTDLKLLWRDYLNSHLMDWKTIGDLCLLEYPNDLKTKIEEKRKEQEEHQRLQTEAYRKKEAEEKIEFQKLIEGVEFKIKDQKAYDDWKDKNKDGYSAVIFEYAENWGKMLQTKLGIKPIKILAEDFDLQPNYLGITGFQHGAAKSILKECWFFGDELKEGGKIKEKV